MKFFVYDQNKINLYDKDDFKFTIKPFPLNFESFKKFSHQECNYFIVPVKIKNKNKIISEKKIQILLNQLEFYEKNKEKHVFFITGDNHEEIDKIKDSIIFQNSICYYSKNLPLHYNALVFPNQIREINQSYFDISFLGNLNFPLRENIKKKLEKNFNLKINISEFDYWNFNKNKKIKEISKINYFNLMNNSKFILCPRGNALNSIRFFETLSFGKIPILISDTIKLPLKSKINYDKICLKIKEKNLDEICDKVKYFMENNDLNLISKECRKIWENYFKEDKFNYFVETSILEKRQKLKFL